MLPCYYALMTFLHHRTSQEMAQSLLPEVDWRGGNEYEYEPYKALINTQLAKEILQWVPRYKWRPSSNASALQAP